MIGWIILGLIVGLIACMGLVDLFHWESDRWKSWVDYEEYWDSVEENERDHFDYENKLGRYADRKGG